MTAQPPSPEPAPTTGNETSDLEGVLSRPALQEGDRVPGWVMRAQGWFVGLVSYERRFAIAVAIIAVAIGIAFVLSGTRLFRIVLEELDLLAYLGLFMVNWLGNGGILVPVPGARLVGLLMIFQQASIMASWEVFLVSGIAMALGLTSYYVAGARSADAYEKGDPEGAQQAVSDPTILSETGQHAMPGPASPKPGGMPDAPAAADRSRRQRLAARFSASWSRAQERAQPAIEKHGLGGMFWLCFVPSPAATAAAFLGGAMRFGFIRFEIAALGSKSLLAAIIVLAGLVFSQQAASIELPV